MIRTLLLLPLVGCTAARATYFLYDADRKFQDAVQAGAEERAPYEYTLASEFLRKAKEEDGYSDFGASEKLARKSMEYSAAAFQKAADDTRPMLENVDNAEHIVPEVKPEEPPETPPEEEPEFDLDLDGL